MQLIESIGILQYGVGAQGPCVAMRMQIVGAQRDERQIEFALFQPFLEDAAR